VVKSNADRRPVLLKKDVNVFSYDQESVNDLKNIQESECSLMFLFGLFVLIVFKVGDINLYVACKCSGK
jgi:hypothetical protein